MGLEVHIAAAGIQPGRVGEVHILQVLGAVPVRAGDVVVLHVHAVSIQMDAHIVAGQGCHKVLHLAHGVEEVADVAQDVLHPDPHALVLGVVRQLHDGVPVIAQILVALAPVRHMLAHGAHNYLTARNLRAVNVFLEPVNGCPAHRRIVGEQAQAVFTQLPAGGKGDEVQTVRPAHLLDVLPVILQGVGQLDLQAVIPDFLGLLTELLKQFRRRPYCKTGTSVV